MSSYVEQLLGQVMPCHAAVALRRMHRREDPALNETLRRYHVSGWGLSALARTLQVDRGTVKHRVATATRHHEEDRPLPDGVFIVVAPFGKPGVPGISRKACMTPEKAEGRRRAMEVIDGKMLRRLRKLQRLAKCCVLGSATDSPERMASEELTSLLWELYHDKGVPMVMLDAAIGTCHGSVQQRLSSHGFLPPRPSRLRRGQIYKNYPVQRELLRQAVDYSVETE